MTNSRTLTDAERHRIDATLRGFSSPQIESHLKTFLHFVEGDPWVCSAVLKQTAAVTQLISVLEGSATGGGKCFSAVAAATTLEILGVLSMRTQSSRVAIPFTKPDGMRLLVRQFNFCDPTTDVALATFLEQLFCGSESDPARTACASVGLLQKIVERMSSHETAPLSISAFARVFVVAAPWHNPRKQAEAHYAIDSFFKIIDLHLSDLVEERMSNAFANHQIMLSENQNQNNNPNNNNQNNNNSSPSSSPGTMTTISGGSLDHTPHAAVVLTEGVVTPMADCYSHVLRCLIVLVSKHVDNSTTSCSQRNLTILAKLVSVVARDTVPSRLIAMILWFVFSIVANSPKLEEAMKNSLDTGFQWFLKENSNESQQQQQSNATAITNEQQMQSSISSRPPSASNTTSSSSSSSSYILGPVVWSLQLAPFRNLCANIPNLLEVIRRDHLRPELVAEALRELCNGAMQTGGTAHHGISRSLARYIIGTPSILKCLLLPVACVDEDLVIRACQLLDFAVESNPAASRSFLFLGGVLTLKDILDDYNPQVLYHGLMLTQHLAQDGWVMRELAERGVLSRIMQMVIEELNSDVKSCVVVTKEQEEEENENLKQENKNNKSNSHHHLLTVANKLQEEQQSATVSSSSQSGTGTGSPIFSQTMSRETLVSTMLQALMTIFKSFHLTTDVSNVLSSQGKHFVCLWKPIISWIEVACASITFQIQPPPQQSTTTTTNNYIFTEKNQQQFESLFPNVVDTSSALIRSVLFRNATSTELSKTVTLPSIAVTISNMLKTLVGSSSFGGSGSGGSNQNLTTAAVSSGAGGANNSRAQSASSTASSNSNSSTALNNTTGSINSVVAVSSGTPRPSSANNNNSNNANINSPQQQFSFFPPSFSVDGVHIVSCCYFLSSCCAVDPSSDGLCQLQLIQHGTISTISKFIAGSGGGNTSSSNAGSGSGAGRVAAWTFLASVSSRIPSAQEAVATNQIIVSVMEAKIRDACNFLDRATTLPRASGRPRSATSPTNQTMNLLQRILECADHIFLAKSKEYGFGYANDVGKILAHPNASMTVRSAALDVLQSMYVISPPSPSSTSSGGITSFNDNNENSSTTTTTTKASTDTKKQPTIIPHLVQLLVLCEDTEDTEAVTMVANRAFKLLLSLPAGETMTTLFKIACDALEMMNVKQLGNLKSPLRTSRNNNNNSENNSENKKTISSEEISNEWKWSPMPALQDADDGHDLMVALLPLINGLLHHETACCEVLFPDSNAWSFFFLLAEAEELQLGLRVLALLALGNMLAKCKTAAKCSIFFQTPELLSQFLRALSSLLKLPSSLDEVRIPAVADIVSRRRETMRLEKMNVNIITSPVITSSPVSSSSSSQQQQQEQNQQREQEEEEELYLPDEAIETIFFILDRLTSFGRKLQSQSFFIPSSSVPKEQEQKEETETESESEEQKTLRQDQIAGSSVLLDTLFCGCFSSNPAVNSCSRSLLYMVFQTEGISKQLPTQLQKDQLRRVLQAIVAEIPPNGSATDPRRQAQAILSEM